MYIYLGRPANLAPAQRFLGQPAPAVTTVPLRRVVLTFTHPFRAVCRIQVHTGKGGDSVGSGVLISRRHVLTCAHVLYDRADPNPLKVTVLPNHAGPDDTRQPIPADAWAVNPAWRSSDCRTAEDDLAIIRLSRRADTEPWPVENFNPSVLASAAIELAGYPAFSNTDKAFWMYRSQGRVLGGFSINCCCDAWPAKCDPLKQRTRDSLSRTDFGPITGTTKLIGHSLDSRRVMSGGPMWIHDNKKPILVALHARDIDNGINKAAVLLNDAVRRLINDWMTRQLRPLPT
jgi:V8-like Glu-specific endopeptidase